MTDYSQIRETMVKSQIIPEEVTDPLLLNAFLIIPRERFVPRQLARIAYMDSHFTFKKGRILLRPATLAKMLTSLKPVKGDKILYVGCTTGYGPAILGHMGVEVTALDSEESFTQEAENLMNDLRLFNVEVVLGPLAEGWENEAPFDKLIIEGAIEKFPKILFSQLKIGGELVTLKHKKSKGTHAIKYVKSKSSITEIPLFDAFAPRLEAFRDKISFDF